MGEGNEIEREKKGEEIERGWINLNVLSRHDMT